MSEDKLQTIYLDVDDEITSVIDKLGNAQGQEATLVIPKGAIVLRSIVNLRLLKKAASRLKKKVVIVTKDETGLNLALKSGFAVKTSLNGKLITAPKHIASQDNSVTIKEYRNSSENGSSAISGPEPEPKRKGLRAVVEAERAARNQGSSLAYSSKGSSKASRSVPVKPVRTVPTRTKIIKQEVNATPKSVLNKKPRQVAGHMSGNQKPLRQKVRLLPKWPWKIIGLVAGGVTVLAFLVLTFGFAGATVTIDANKELMTLDTELTVKPEPDTNKKEVSGKLIDVSEEGKKSIKPTGEKETGEKAVGSIVISNSYSDKPRGLGVGTDLITSEGLIFRFTSQVTVPGAKVEKGKTVPGTVTAGIVADTFGEQYNIGPTSFTIGGLSAEEQAKVTATSQSATSGGTLETVTILTAEDVDKAKEELDNELKPKVKAKIAEQVGDDQEIVEGAEKINVGSPESSVLVGTEAEKVEIKLKVSGQAIVNNSTEVEDKILAELEATLNDNQELINKDETKISYSFKEIDFRQKRLILEVKGEQEAVFNFDEDKLRTEIAGLAKKEALDALNSMNEIQEAKVSITPFWRRSLPSSHKRLKFRYN